MQKKKYHLFVSIEAIRKQVIPMSKHSSLFFYFFSANHLVSDSVYDMNKKDNFHF